MGTGRRERGRHREEGKRWARRRERGGYQEEGKRWAPGKEMGSEREIKKGGTRCKRGSKHVAFILEFGEGRGGGGEREKGAGGGGGGGIQSQPFCGGFKSSPRKRANKR